MDNFSEIIQTTIEEGDFLDAAIRKASLLAAKEAVESLLQSELSTLLGYTKYSPKGKNSGDSRNGSYERTLQTFLGPITVNIPRNRNGEFEVKALPRYQRRGDLITSTILKLYSSGMSDEEMRLAIGSIYEAKYSRSTISSITDAILEDVERFKKRALPTRCFAVFLDSIYVPLRRNTVQKEAVNIALGISDSGESFILGYSITPEESSTTYRELLESFKSRGLKEVEIAISDGLSGIDEVVSSIYPKAKRQRCFVHLLRNICSKVRSSDRIEAADDFMKIAKQEDKDSAQKEMGSFVQKWRKKYPKLRLWADKIENVLTFYEFPKGLRRLIYTNNRIESFNKQIRRMVKKQIQFVTEEALEKKMVSMFLHYNEALGRRKIRC